MEEASGQSQSSTARCLVVEDDIDVAYLVVEMLRGDGFAADTAYSGEDAVKYCQSEKPDVVILDFGLPGISGLETASQIREFSDAYIVMLTGRSNENDRALALSTTVDDYVVKPFSGVELVARVRALLRRPRSIVGSQPDSVAVVGSLKLDSKMRHVMVADVPVATTRIEFEILAALMLESPAPVERTTLIERAWGSPTAATAHVVDVHINNLRKKLAAAGLTGVEIEVVRGVGFRISERM